MSGKTLFFQINNIFPSRFHASLPETSQTNRRLIFLKPGIADFQHPFLHDFYIRSISLYKIFSRACITFGCHENCMRGEHGHRFFRPDRGVFSNDVGACDRLPQTGATAMNTFYFVGAVVAAGLLVYLIVVLLNAENL